MILLGILVGHGSTVFDQHILAWLDPIVGEHRRTLLVFTSPTLDWILLGICTSVSLYRHQWSTVLVILICPIIARYTNAGLKLLFDRHNGPYLEYPSGHTTALIVVLSFIIIVFGQHWWTWTPTIIIGICGVTGLITCRYHYSTDTIGSFFLATSLVSASMQLTQWVTHKKNTTTPGIQ